MSRTIALEPTFREFLLLFLSWTVGFAPVVGSRRGWTWSRGVGLALVSYPLLSLAIGVLESFDRLLVPTVLSPLTPLELLWNAYVHFAIYFLVPSIGLLLIFEGYPLLHTRDPKVSLGRWKRGWRWAGLGPRRSLRIDVGWGVALLPPVLLLYGVGVFLVQGAFSSWERGDESRVFEEVTLPWALLLSLGAGLSEEFLFRGILLSFWDRLFGRKAPWATGNVLQSIFFGLVHSGYATISHVLGPFLFGLGLGWVARRVGLWASIVLHTGIDLAAFALVLLSRGDGSGGVLLGSLLAVSLLFLVKEGRKPYEALRGNFGRSSKRTRGD